MGANKFLKGMVYGAFIGGAVTLLDKETRKEVFIKSKEIGENVKGLAKNPKETYKYIQDKFIFFRDSLRDMNEEIQFIMKQASEIKELGKDTVKLMEETREVFHKEKAEDGEAQKH